LLGLSCPAERERIESEYFENDDAFQEMLTAEDDLIDAYARGELLSEERQSFEKSVVSSMRERVQFARAFENAVSRTPSVKTKLAGTTLNMFKTFQSPRPLRTATIAAVIVLVALLAWLVNDRRRMTNELRQLRAESAELNNRTENLQRSSATERTRAAEIAAQFAELRSQSDKPRRSGHKITISQRAQPLPEIKNDFGMFEMIEAKPGEALTNTHDASISPAIERKTITELPLNAGNVVGLLTLQPGITHGGYVAGGRSDQANSNLNGGDIAVKPLNTYTMAPNTPSHGESVIRLPSSLSWIRFQIVLETAAIHEDYRVTIKTEDDRPVTSVDWTEPLTQNQTIIDTPVVSTAELATGSYVLSLMGKEPDGSYVKVAEYAFKIIK